MGYADDMFDLTGRVVLITGGSRGLGKQMALAAAHCGADVVIASRDHETCTATAKEIETATGRTAMPYAVHVGRWDDTQFAASVRAHALQRIGRATEVAGAALYLISDAATYTTSATLRVDGGMP